MKTIQNTEISWKDSTPYSNQFGDFYFNSDGGIEETLHVFVDPSALSARYSDETKDYLCINETGFGTGLNFYCTLHNLSMIDRHRCDKPFYFFSSELFPLSAADFKKSISSFPQFAHITDQILAQYPPAIKGYHRLTLNNSSIYLTLMFDDSLSAYQQSSHKADIWYLDGFSPAKNSDMWQPELFRQIARLSNLNETTLATFTSAGAVRRSLQDQGFSVTKRSGFGKKREMITATYSREKHFDKLQKPWFEYQTNPLNIKEVAVIGAGLAGCTTAEALARRGIKVTIFDSANAICSHGSGNLQGALYAKLPSKPTISGELHLTGLEYSLRLLNIYDCFDKTTAEQCGVLQLATSPKEQAQQQDLLRNNTYNQEVVRWVDAASASELIGSHTPFDGLFFPRAGWVMPKLFCEKLVDNANIQLMLNTHINSLSQSSNSKWTLTCERQTYAFDAVVIANARSAKQFSQFSATSVKAIRGQVTHCQSNNAPSLNTVVCGAGYISPATNNTYCFGASFNLQNQDLALTTDDQRTNISNLQKVLPELAAQLNFSDKPTGKAAHRCSTPDYLPQVGPAPKHDQFIEQYKKLNKDKNWQFDDSPAPNYMGLYLNIGHGSKGLITCPLSAEHLACTMLDHPSPLPRDLSNAIHPARFVIKHLIKRAI